jgi:hypothetical protein
MVVRGFTATPYLTQDPANNFEESEKGQPHKNG